MTASVQLEFLLVSADYPTLRAVKDGLKDLDANLGCMPTLESAREYIARRKIDGIILDLGMHSALELISHIRQGTANPHAVIFACVRGRQESAAAMEAGANVLLQKPLKIEDIVSNVTAARELMARERRRYFRYPVVLPVMIEDDGTEQRGTMVNLSEGGMAARVARVPPRDSLVGFSFQLPTRPGIRGKGQVAWTSDEGVIGVRFEFLRGDGKEHLLSWLALRKQGI